MKFQTSGYRSKSILMDVGLGIFEGVDNASWCYAFATVLFAGAFTSFLPLMVVVLLCGWALTILFVSTTSATKLHIMKLDEQAVVILASLSGLLVANVGFDVMSTSRLATMLAIMSLTSVTVALCFFAVGKFQLTLLLEKYGSESPERSIEDHLNRIFDDEKKARILKDALTCVDCEEGETLFRQGDPDGGFYILERGSVTACIETTTNGMRRVKKFQPGAVIGEMSSYTLERIRTATLIADEPSVLWHMTTEKLSQLDSEHFKQTASIHELVARTLGSRIAYMNRRLMLELR